MEEEEEEEEEIVAKIKREAVLLHGDLLSVRVNSNGRTYGKITAQAKRDLCNSAVSPYVYLPCGPGLYPK